MAHRVRWYGAASQRGARNAVLVLRGAAAAAAAIGAPRRIFAARSEGWKTCAGWTAWKAIAGPHRLMPAKPPGRGRPVAPRRLGGALVSGGSRGYRNHGRRGGRVEGASRELQAAARFAQRPGCGSDICTAGWRARRRRSSSAAGEHRGGAHLRCTRLRAGAPGCRLCAQGRRPSSAAPLYPYPYP